MMIYRQIIYILISWTWINIHNIYITLIPSACQKVKMWEWHEATTVQREQYMGTVHLFIGTERNPYKITSMTLLTNYNHNADY